MDRSQLSRCQRIVVKLGSRLVRESPVGRPAAIADELVSLRAERGVGAIVVSSGAIALGVRALRLATRPTDLPEAQAVAAIGQGLLMQSWERAFGAHDLHVGQVLLTHADLADRTRFLNARRALAALLELGAVPIVNENDTVSTEEIRFGDNDRLAALVCNLVSADLLVILTDVDGLHDAAPERGGKRIPIVTDVEREAAPVAGGATAGSPGTGGMASKVEAARIAARNGIPTVVAPGRSPHVLRHVLAGADVGTLFCPEAGRMPSRKHWLAFAQRPGAALIVDEGARRALVVEKKSLLPAGIVEVRGRFAAGDAVSVLAPDGAEVARGLAAFASDEVERIRGRKSADIESILGYISSHEVIHRDDLVVL